MKKRNYLNNIILFTKFVFKLIDLNNKYQKYYLKVSLVIQKFIEKENNMIDVIYKLALR